MSTGRLDEKLDLDELGVLSVPLSQMREGNGGNAKQPRRSRHDCAQVEAYGGRAVTERAKMRNSCEAGRRVEVYFIAMALHRNSSA